VPDVVDCDYADLVVVADSAEGPSQVPGFDRPTAASGEHQAGVLPGSTKCFPVGGLLLLTNEQRGAHQAWNRQIAASGAERAGAGLAADLGRRRANRALISKAA
jgi:hypothetical protein